MRKDTWRDVAPTLYTGVGYGVAGTHGAGITTRVWRRDAFRVEAVLFITVVNFK